MNTNEIKYFIYVRKSSEGKERQGLSLDGQLLEIKKIIEREGLIVVDCYQESKSAHIPNNRPLFNEMLKRIRRGQANGIITWHTNRLSRNPKEAGIIQQMLQDGIIKSIVVPYRHFQSEDNSLLFSIESSEANQYSRDLKVVVKRGLLLKCTEFGQPPNIAPQGYLNTKSSERHNNKIIVDDLRFPLLRKAFELMLTCQYSVQKVASVLNNEYNYRTRSSKQRLGKPLSVSVLHRVLTNQFYTGYFKYSGKVYKGSYAPMITLEEFDTVQQILKRTLKDAPHKHEFAFTGIMKCGVCGCAITGSRKVKMNKTTGQYKTYTFYHCTKRKGSAVCTEKVYMTESDMESQIETELQKLAMNPKWKPWIVETLREDNDTEVEKRKAMVKATQDYERQLNLEIDNLLDLRISGDLTEQQFRQKKAEREALLLRVQERAKREENAIDTWIEDVSNALDFTDDLIDKFKNGAPAFQKHVCRQIGWNWALQGKKLTFTTFEWFFEMANMINQFDQEKDRLEPVKTFAEYRQTASYNKVRPYMSALRDVIRKNKNRPHTD